ncbi:MAG: 16S rRNA processing protein RimM [Bdellovibrio sp. CG10_big_fil_rev_8_21_14_0_10_47_8]|nr:MAG: 16S rRNA processing protein RimM [Bdellovibrio sp. CG10_big_fil_rev_8_21_14_0_10_47_8]
MSLNPSAWKKVGKIKSAHGLKGELSVFVFSGEASWLKKLKQFGLGIDHENDLQRQIVSYTVDGARQTPTGLILKTLEIEDRTQAEKLKGQIFYIPEELLRSQAGETIFLHEIEGFQLIDVVSGQGGIISGFSSNGVQDLLVVTREDGRQVEIPFVAPFIVKIDFKSETLQMKLPEGLLRPEDL